MEQFRTLYFTLKKWGVSVSNLDKGTFIYSRPEESTKLTWDGDDKCIFRGKVVKIDKAYDLIYEEAITDFQLSLF